MVRYAGACFPHLMCCAEGNERTAEEILHVNRNVECNSQSKYWYKCAVTNISCTYYEINY